MYSCRVSSICSSLSVSLCHTLTQESHDLALNPIHSLKSGPSVALLFEVTECCLFSVCCIKLSLSFPYKLHSPSTYCSMRFEGA